MKSCAFTGHRKIVPEHYNALVDLLFRGISYVYSEGVRDFYIGGAVGFDTIAAQQVLRFRINHPDVKIHLVLPCMNQSERWSERQRDMYEYILSSADTVEILYENYVDGCMRDRNRRLVDYADVLIAYVGKGGSGSAQTRRMAEEKGITIYNLYYKCQESIMDNI